METAKRLAAAWRDVAIVVAGTLTVSAMALWNGYPLVYSDSGTYLASSFGPQVPVDRPVFYGLFLRAWHWKLSLWPPLLAQAAILTLAVRGLVGLYAPIRGRVALLALLAALVVTTPLPWVAGQLVPDAWTGLCAIAIFVLREDPLAQRGWRAWVWRALLVASILVHLSHLPLALGLLAALALRDLLRGSATVARGASLRVLACVLASVAIALGVNLRLTGELLLSRVSSSFLVSRLVQDGIVQQLLADVCDERDYRLCRHRRDIRPSALHFLWDPESPTQKVGGLLEMEKEAGSIAIESLRRYPWMHLQAGVRSTLRLLGEWEVGDGLQAYPKGHWVEEVVRKRFPGEHRRYVAALQQRDLLPVRLAAAVQRRTFPLYALASALVVLALPWSGRLGSRELHVLAWLALLVNAVVCGLLSGPFPRYQTRLVWLVPLACLVSLWEAAAGARRADARLLAPGFDQDLGVPLG